MLEKSHDLDFEMAELLVCADFLKPHQLDRAYAACRDEGVPLRILLVNNKMVSQEMVTAAMEVNREVKEGRLPHSQARTVLYLMGQCRITMNEALTKIGMEKPKNPWEQNLRDLTESQKMKALKEVTKEKEHNSA
jgi:hypothetical protein